MRKVYLNIAMAAATLNVDRILEKQKSRFNKENNKNFRSQFKKSKRRKR